MKKRLLSLLAALALTLSLAAPAALAADEDTMLETVRVLGILSGDENGNLNLSAPVTRAEFVKMMTAASTYKDSVGSSTASLFTDVKSGCWANGYIKLAVEQGWVTGYVDGSFRPDNTITLEEACTALLRLLGYDSGSLAGSFPDAQLSKSKSIGLLDDLSAVQGQTLTREDCVILFYNLLTCQNSAGTVYGTTLGYTVTNGEVDYSTLVTNDTKGPYISSGGTLSLPFGTDNITVYRNGSLSDLSAVSRYDVYYYNENMRTVWVYSDRVTGTLTAVSPDSAAPTSVTVAGGTYTLGTSTAVYQFSSQGSFAAGDTVTLLLGMNGQVVSAVTAAESSGAYCGVVLSSSKAAATSATGADSGAGVQTTTEVACSDGTVRTFYHSGSAFTAGRLVTVTVDEEGTTVKALSTRPLTGAFNSDGTRLAGYDLADDAEILDTDGSGGYARLYPDRLAGVQLKSGDVRYYSLNENGEIDRLILDEVTGDTLTYVYVTGASSSNSDMSVSGTYTYLLDGAQSTISGSTIYNISVGGALIQYEDGQIKSLRQLSSVHLTELHDLYAMADNQKYLLDENVQVLLKDSGVSGTGYYLTTLSELDAGNYSLTGWYDDLGCSAGGRIRIIVATEI
ncbi:S-layer homology domain-containing protein [uncultured Intestinimonas sp.]|uniref:S-layer homology domain-containing protein n=1 Tax=uncultured Intestinimonas sp. TaxID=1689265 RepID=UPI0025F8F386|nr:S-layer homology domain-containing protein [uncultured Intestinimonas sp.]